MTKSSIRTVVVKVGTNVITKESGLLDTTIMKSLVAQIAALRGQGIRVLLVSSGAVGAGRSIVDPSAKLGRISRRQVLAAVGQVKLIETYAKFFAVEKAVCAQVLATKEDFRDRHHYLNMRRCLEVLLSEEIVPIINENDVVAIDELMFTDNDELAGLIATMVGAEMVVILSSVAGLYDGDPKDPTSKILPEIDPGSAQWKSVVRPGTSSFGRGGMSTKCATAEKLSGLGIATVIAHGHETDVLTRIVAGQKVGTRFTARKQASSMKRWVAGSEERVQGQIWLNEGAVAAISSADRIASVLPVGITKIEGEFQKGDVIRILGPKDQKIGLGIAQYGSARAKEAIGKKGQQAIVHYDYLYLYG